MQRFAIHGVPRSGTSWLGEIINSSPRTLYRFQPLFSYALKGRLTPSSTAADIDAFFDDLARTDDDFILQAEGREAGRLPRFTKADPTHLGYKEVRYHHILPNLLARDPGIRLVLIVRGPLATLASWLGAPREFRRDLGWKVGDEWLHAPSKNLDRPEEFNGYTRWKEANRLFEGLAARHAGRVRLIRYENLSAAPIGETEALFRFLDLPLEAPTRDFLASRRESDDPYSVFRSDRSSDTWRDRLPDFIETAVREDLDGDPLATYLEPSDP